MTADDGLAADIAALRRELLDWILTEVRSGRDVGAPLADDLVELVRRGLKAAVADAVHDFEGGRAAVAAEALAPQFQQLTVELRRLHSDLQSSVTADLTREGERSAGLINRLQQRLAAGSAHRPAEREADYSDAIAPLARRRVEPRVDAAAGVDGPVRRRTDGWARALSSTWAPAVLAGSAALVVGLAAGGGAGWIMRDRMRAPPAVEVGVGEAAQNIEAKLDALAPAGTINIDGPAPLKIDPQIVAGDLAPVAKAIGRASQATDANGRRDAHQDALAGLAEVEEMLAAAVAAPQPAAPAAPPRRAPGRRPPR